MSLKFSLIAHWIIFFFVLLYISLQIQKPTPAKKLPVDISIEQYWEANLCTVFTSLIYSEDYLPGVLVLFQSLREHHSFLSCDKFEVLISEHVAVEVFLQKISTKIFSSRLEIFYWQII